VKHWATRGVAALASAAIIAGCGGGAHYRYPYPHWYATEFQGGCEYSGTSPARCRCILRWMQQNVPWSTAENESIAILEHGTLPSWAVPAATYCANPSE